MNNIANQLILRLVDGRVLAPSVPEQRALARSLLLVGRPFGLFLFHAPDTHIHVLVRAGGAAAVECGRRMKLSLRLTLGLEVSFAPRDVRPVRDQHHLEYAVHYILRNGAHHGVQADPVLEASNLPDLVGLRVIGRYTATTLHRLLPRLRQREILPYLGVRELPEGRDLRFLVESAAASVGIMDLAVKHPIAVAARVAAIRAGRDLGATTGDLVQRLGSSETRVRKLGHRQPNPEILHAVRLQMGVRGVLAAVASSAPRPPTPERDARPGVPGARRF